jgi:hypothetical protein
MTLEIMFITLGIICFVAASFGFYAIARASTEVMLADWNRAISAANAVRAVQKATEARKTKK